MRTAVMAAVVTIGVLGLGVWFLTLPQGAGGNSLTLYGNVEIRELELSFRQPGRVLEMRLEEGERVEPETLLATLDSGPYRDQLTAAQAELTGAQAGLRKLENGSRPEEVERARAEVQRIEARLGQLSLDLTRQENLVESGATSEKALEALRANHTETTAALTAARQTLALLQAGPRAEDIEQARARVQGAEAKVARAQRALSDTQLYSPRGGVILSRVREPGSMVSSRDPVYVLSLDDAVYVLAWVEETELARVSPGTPVTLGIDSSSETYRGTVGFVSPRAEFTPRSVQTTELRTDLVYRLRITVQGESDGLLQGMPVTISLSK